MNTVPDQLRLFVVGLPTDLRQWRNPRQVGASDAVAEPHQLLASAILRLILLATAVLTVVAIVLGKPAVPNLTLAAASLGLFLLLSNERYSG